jgi:AraC-like DNA-binding protein
VRLASSASGLIADPIGSYLYGRGFAVWVQTPQRLGAFHIGRPDEVDYGPLATLFPLLASPSLVAPYDLLHDLGSVDVLDHSSFGFFEGFLASWIDLLAQRARRVAVIRPSGLAGAAFTGLFYKWVTPRFDAKLCTARSEAYEWLGIAEAARSDLDAIYDEFSQPTLLRDLREAILTNLQHASLETVAEILQMSPHTLQRQLSQCGTSFRAESMRARIQISEALLLDGCDKIETIARAVGFSSTSSFSATFTKIVGESPNAFRALRVSPAMGRPDAATLFRSKQEG